MIRKSGHRFSEKDHAQQKNLERDGDSIQSHRALGRTALRVFPFQPSHDLVELLQRAIVDVYGAGGILVIDADLETHRIRKALLERHKIWVRPRFLTARLA